MCLGQKKIADNIYEICFEKPKELKLKPGQFMMLKVDEKQCFLRRPFSFSEITEESFSIIYQVVGKGTQAMTKMRQGHMYEALLPLGNGFPIHLLRENQSILLVAGGLGYAPLMPVVDMLIEEKKSFSLILGVNNPKRLYGLDKKLDMDQVEVMYSPQTVMDSKLLKEEYQLVMACGPEGMYEALKPVFESHASAYYSLEAPMACGTGLCSGCICKGKKVCVEGPVIHVKEYYQ